MSESPTNIEIFKSLFKGRDDVFAIRWEKGNKNGYMPAYFYDPYLYKAHKMKGGTFQNFSNKSYLQLSDKEISKHLDGVHLIGIYPLLLDNTSWFIVADFDKANWIEECKLFLETCHKNNIPAYLERSRSGKGGHVWIFFDKPFPAIRSRKIIITLLKESGLISDFDKTSSFDRLFPNQDFLSGKSLGNLIALPLYKQTFEQGNSCFIEHETLQPIQDQFAYLSSIKRVSIDLLESLLKSKTETFLKPISVNAISKLTITLDNTVTINRVHLNTHIINFLKDELNFANTEFFIKSKSGKSTYGTDR